jgi:hypothetical protein
MACRQRQLSLWHVLSSECSGRAQCTCNIVQVQVHTVLVELASRAINCSITTCTCTLVQYVHLVQVHVPFTEEYAHDKKNKQRRRAAGHLASIHARKAKYCGLQNSLREQGQHNLSQP